MVHVQIHHRNLKYNSPYLPGVHGIGGVEIKQEEPTLTASVVRTVISTKLSMPSVTVYCVGDRVHVGAAEGRGY